MTLTPEERDALKQQVVACLRNEPEVRRIVIEQGEAVYVR